MSELEGLFQLLRGDVEALFMQVGAVLTGGGAGGRAGGRVGAVRERGRGRGLLMEGFEGAVYAGGPLGQPAYTAASQGHASSPAKERVAPPARI